MREGGGSFGAELDAIRPNALLGVWTKPALLAFEKIVQGAAGLGPEPLRLDLERLDPVEPEGPEVDSELAPAGQQPHRSEISERQRPDCPLGRVSGGVLVFEMDLELLAKGLPQLRDVEGD